MIKLYPRAREATSDGYSRWIQVRNNCGTGQLTNTIVEGNLGSLAANPTLEAALLSPNHIDGTPAILAFAERLGLGETERTLCPWCSSTRRKRDEKCLKVTIDDKGYIAFCHHCEQTEKHITTPVSRKWRPMPAYAGPVDYDRGRVDHLANWFKLRHIEPETIDAYQVGLGRSRGMRFYDLQDMAITFPVFDNAGKVGNIKFRSAPEKEFRQIRDPLPGFFGRQFLDKSGMGSVFITEGEIDAMSLHQCGFSPAISVPNGAINNPVKVESTKFNYLDNDGELLANYDRVYLAVDGDGPGVNLRMELAQRLGKARCYVVTYPEGCKDANDVLVRFGPSGIEAIIAEAKPIPIEGLGQFGDILDEAWSDAEGERDWGFSTGFPELDKLLRIRPGELTTVTGRPNAGKSSFLNQICVNLAKFEGQRIAIASFEQLEVRLFNELIAKVAHGPVHGGAMQREQYNRHAAWVAERFFPLRFTEVAPTPDLVLEAAEAALRRYGIDVLVIDGYSNLQFSGTTEARERVQAFLARCAGWAKKTKVAVFLIAHPRKMMGNDVPTAYDISESAMWYNLNDNIIVVNRPKDENFVTEIYIEKNRLMGYRGDIRLSFDPASTTYSDIPYY